MSVTRDFLRMMKNAFYKKKTVAWTIKDESVVWRVSNDSEPKINEIGEIRVNEGERTALFRAGVFQSALGPGTHKVISDINEIVFVDVTPKTEIIGIPAPNYSITKDKKSFGFSGNIVFKIQEDNVSVGNFIKKILGSMKTIKSEEIAKWLQKGLLFQVFKEMISEMTYEEFINFDRINLMMDLETRLAMELRDYGLEIVSVELKYFTPPRDFN